MRRMILILLALLTFSIPAMAQIPTQDELNEMSLDELYDLRTMLNNTIAAKEEEAAAVDDVDYCSMPLDDAIITAAAASNNRQCEYREYEFYPGEELIIHVDIVNNHVLTGTISSTIEFSIDFARRIFPRDDVITIRFMFHEPRVNKYGNTVDQTPIIYKIKESTFRKMNIDYFYETASVNHKAFWSAIDSNAVFAEYKRVAK